MNTLIKHTFLACSASALLLGGFPVVAANHIQQQQVHFKKGAASATVRGHIQGDQTVDYKLHLAAGQTLAVLFKPTNRSAYFNVLPPGSQEAVFIGSSLGNTASVQATVAGNYTVRVYLMRNAARRHEGTRYTLDMRLADSDPATAPPLGYSVDNMDTSVSPRKDFYGYAVGRWLKRTEIPASEADVGGFSLLAANLDKQLLKLIQDAAATPAPAGSPRQQIGDFYTAAMDLARMDALGLKPVQDDLDAIAAAGATPADYGTLAARIQAKFGISPLVNASATPDAKDSSRQILVLAPGLQVLEQDEYAKPESRPLRDLYRDHMAAMFTGLGQPSELAAQDAQQVLAMEASIAAGRLTAIQMRDPGQTYNIMTLAQAQALIPGLDLTVFLNTLGVPVTPTLQVFDVGGLKAVQTMLASRSPAELKAMMRWYVLGTHAAELGRPWRQLDQEFSRQRKGLAAAPKRERVVTQQIGTQLFHPLSQLYVQAFFPESTRRDITRMVGHVKEEFAQRLRTNTWLDEPTRAAALDKLAKVDIQVGYPQQWIDFSGVVVKPEDHFGNVQRLNDFVFRREVAQIGKPVLKDRFASPSQTTPISVNAAYDPQTNSIDITAAIVQPPFYKPGADAAVNYCTIGAVIGHELTHGFDSFGRQFGPAGNLRDWWTPQATAEFKKRTDVLVKQYSQYTILPGLQHNGELTLTENTADLGGITLGYAALQRELAGQTQPKVDGLTTDQRCFVAWSQLWAYKGRPERLRLLAQMDYHGNSRLRGFVPLLHLDSFHQAFGTRPGDPMWRAPKDRVLIW